MSEGRKPQTRGRAGRGLGGAQPLQVASATEDPRRPCRPFFTSCLAPSACHRGDKLSISITHDAVRDSCPLRPVRFRPQLTSQLYSAGVYALHAPRISPAHSRPECRHHAILFTFPLICLVIALGLTPYIVRLHQQAPFLLTMTGGLKSKSSTTLDRDRIAQSRHSALNTEPRPIRRETQTTKTFPSNANSSSPAAQRTPARSFVQPSSNLPGLSSQSFEDIVL